MSQLELRNGAEATEASPAAAEPANSPDWDAIGRDVSCPLCGYNLRGLAEPRCPECGYAFAWADVLREDRPRHPYLFESHPEANVWSFFRTLLGGLPPRRFWRLLTPLEPPRPGRLFLYWFLATSLVWLGLAATIAPELVRAAQENQSGRAIYAAQMQWLQRSMTARQKAAAAAQADALYPPTFSPAFLSKAISRRGVTSNLVKAAITYAAWPWATLATLMIFRASMRRAKVKTFHVVRCVLYSGDVGVLLVPLIYVVLETVGYNTYVPREQAALVLVAAVIAPFTAYRLACAYELYLKFDRPWATAISAQVIVWLLVAVVALNT